MTEQAPSQTLAVLHYWHQVLWQTFANQLPLTDDDIAHCQPLDPEALRQGQLATGEDARAGIVWLAPIVWQNATCENNPLYWIPLWLPALVTDGQLTPCLQRSPWVPPSQFDILMDSYLFSESISQLDAFLRHDLDEDMTWVEWLDASFEMLDSLSLERWQEKLKTKGFSPLKQGFWVPEKKLMVAKPYVQTYADLLATEQLPERVARFATVSLEVTELPEPREKPGGFCGIFSNALPLSQQESLTLGALLASPHPLIAVQGPLNGQLQKVQAAFLACALVQAAQNEQDFPACYRLAPIGAPFDLDIAPFTQHCLTQKVAFSPQQVVNDCQALIDGQIIDKETLGQTLLHQLQLQYENYIAGLEVFEQYCQETRSSEFGEKAQAQKYIEALQKEDEAYEKEFGYLLSLQTQMQQKKRNGLFSKLFGRHLTAKSMPMDEKYPTIEDVGNRLRQIKVLRAKIHQKIMMVADKMASCPRTRLWQQWLVANQITLPNALFATEDIIAYIQRIFAEKLGMLATYYWLAKTSAPTRNEKTVKPSIFPGWQLQKCQMTKQGLTFEVVDHIEGRADLLLIDFANQLVPQQVAPLLAFCQKVVMLGDEKDGLPMMTQTPFAQEKALAAFELDDQELLEELDYRGHASPNGSALQVLIRQADNQVPDCGVHRLPSVEAHTVLADYAYYLEHKTLATEGTTAEDIQGIHLLPVEGKSEMKTNGLVNLMEAKAIVDWLQKGAGGYVLSQVVVVTPFAAQKALLDSLMLQQQLTVSVVTLSTLPPQTKPVVVFSPTYSAGDPRPFVFDQGDNWLYGLIVRAQQAMWIIGDTRLFDPKTHSPSGCLAKALGPLFEKEQEMDFQD